MNVHQNSIDAYHSQEAKLSRRAREVLAWITQHGPHTDRGVMQGMGFVDMNQIRPRVSELIQRGMLMEVCNSRCPVTGKTVRKVDIRRARQEPLWS